MVDGQCPRTCNALLTRLDFRFGLPVLAATADDVTSVLTSTSALQEGSCPLSHRDVKARCDGGLCVSFQIIITISNMV